MNMKLRYRLFLRRKSVYYAFDNATKTFTTLKTKDIWAFPDVADAAS